MPIDRAPWNTLVDDDGSNLVGTIWDKDKIKTVVLDPVDAALVADGGRVQHVAFNAADYGVYPSGAWTVAVGNMTSFSYAVTQQIAHVTIQLTNSVVTGTPSFLSIKSPLTAPRRTVTAARLIFGSALELCSVYFEVADNRFYLQRSGSQLFPAGTITELSFSIPVFRV